MSEAVRWGILGAAGINQAMAPAIVAASNARLVAIASRSQEKAEAAAAEFSAERAVLGYEALLADPEIEAVYVPLPNSLHREWVIKAAAAGKHVLCEKPMAVTAAEAREMIAACDDEEVLLAEAYMYAHHPRYERIARLIAAGEIGEIRSIVTTFSFDASDDLEHSGFQGMPGSGALYDVGCYALHSARRLLGTEPVAVTASAVESALHGGIDMTTSALVEFNGATLLFHVGMAGADTDVLEVIGSSGRIVVPHAFICGPGDGDFLVHTGESVRTESVPETNHYVAQVERFSSAVRGATSLLFEPSDPVGNAAALEAATLSYRERRRVTLA